MRIYLDVSCLNRPFDDQRQPRIRLEAEAVAIIFERVDAGILDHVSSQMAEIEIAAIADEERRRRVIELLPAPDARIALSEAVLNRAEILSKIGFKPADAAHVASAEAGGADVLLTCDDRMMRCAHRQPATLDVRVENPLQWVEEKTHASDT